MRPERRSGGLRTARGRAGNGPPISCCPCWSKPKAINPRGLGDWSPSATRFTLANLRVRADLYQKARTARPQLSCALSSTLAQSPTDHFARTPNRRGTPVGELSSSARTSAFLLVRPTLYKSGSSAGDLCTYTTPGSGPRGFSRRRAKIKDLGLRADQDGDRHLHPD